MQDVLAWSFTKNGRYNVKFGYHVAKQLRLVKTNSGEALVQPSNISLWSRIWKARVPNKIRIFSWRACHNILPMKDNLVKRRVLEDARCCFCHKADELVLHVL